MLAGRGSIFVVGGVESMSNIPLLFQAGRRGKIQPRQPAQKVLAGKCKSLAAFRPKDFQPRIGLLLGLTDPVCGLNMGETAELLAREFARDAAPSRTNSRFARTSAPSPPAKNWPRKFARFFPI